MSDRRTLRPVGAVLLVVAMALGSLGIVPLHPGVATPSTSDGSSGTTSDLAAVAAAPLTVVPDNEPGLHLAGATELGSSSAPAISVLISFGFSNATRLSAVLAGISTPGSPTYHQFLTQSQFDAEFGFPAAEYRLVVDYLRSLGVTGLTTYADRESVSFQASASEVGRVFHTTIATYAFRGTVYYAPSGPIELPTPIARLVGSVEGLSSYSASLNRVLHAMGDVRSPPSAVTPPPARAEGYLAPPTIGGVQYEYAPDFQIAYDEPSLLQQAGDPGSEVVATILWSGVYNGTTSISTPYGTLAPGTEVGSFVPGDISAYYAETLPAGEAAPTVTGVPLDGAPGPGGLASYDTTGAVGENTLDMEMVGSTAPGAKLFNVYGPNSTNVDLDEAFDFILNPNGSYPGLANVSVISNSWGGTDANDTDWYNLTEEAAARGITVLAASGDSGDDPDGPGASADPSGQVTFFPASMAYDDFGDVAVGGTTVVLDPTTLQMTTNEVWWVSPNDTANHGPAGSTGGISQVFAEPSWQADTSANQQIGGAGRGVPDIAALANNTLITISINGIRYDATNATTGGQFFYAEGTSIASPLEAGIFADVDHVLRTLNDSPLGFVDPPLYALADLMNEPLTTTATTGFIPVDGYVAPLPALPFYDVVTGSNYLYGAGPGYDLATGWGSVDAYNFTLFFATSDPTDVPGELSGVRALLNLTGLQVTSTFPGGGVNNFYNASLQQNFFLADSLGAPIYWVQNVVYINWTAHGWAMNFTGWVVFPFYGLYPSEVIYEYNFPITGQILSPPTTFDLTTRLVNQDQFDGQSVVFSFGVAGTPTLTLPVPGASFIIGDLWYNYSWGGQNFSNGPYPAPYGGPGGLSPQFGLIGGPSGGIGNFDPATSGNLSLYLQRSGVVTFVPGTTEAFGEATTQTGETAANLAWEEASTGNLTAGVPAVWNATYVSGATAQGVLEYDAGPPIARYSLHVNESGLPAGLLWGIALAFPGSAPSIFGSTNQTTLETGLANGTYDFTVLSPAGWTATPPTGQITVSGVPVWLNLSFAVTTYGVNFTEAGLPAGLSWWVNETTGSFFTTNASYLLLVVPNGTYTFLLSGGDWSPHPGAVTVFVDGSSLIVPVSFTPPPDYGITFVATGLPAGAEWSAVLGSSGPITTNASTIAFEVPNGTYRFALSTSYPNYVASPRSGSVTVNGSGFSVPVSFGLPTFAVLFVESGLPTGDAWSIEVQNGPTFSGTAGNFSWRSPNGTYNFSVRTEASGWAPNETQANLTVAGNAVVVALTFVQVTYAVTFAIGGLPVGSNWTLSLAGRSPIETSSTSLGFSLPNGSYAYSVGVPSPYNVTPRSGTVTVAGLGQSVNFTAVAPASASGSTVSLSDGEWAALIGAVAIAGLAVAYFVAHRRRSRTPPPKAPATPPTAPGP